LRNDRDHNVVLGIMLAFLLSSAACAATKPATTTGLYDVNFSGVDIRHVLEVLALRSGANIVVSPETSGEVTAHLKQMPIEAILDHLSTVHGFKWAKNGNAYLIAPKERLEPPEQKVDQASPPPPPPEARTLVWNCKHIQPGDITAMVTKLFPSVNVAEGPRNVTPELNSSSSAASAGSGGSSSSGSSQGSKATSTTVVLLGPPDDIAKVEDLLAKLDVARPQISIQVAITEINSSVNNEVGIDWTFSDLVLSEATPNSGISFGKFTKEGMTFTGAISALLKNGGANLLAQPNISVVDGECADILIGERILYPKLVGYTQFGTPIYDKAEERVGIYLQIAPKVTGDEIIMSLYPQVSLVTSYLKTQSGNYPQIITREARTTVTVKNGTTLAIGGLLRDDEIREVSKIPLLGDIPILGQLFRHTKKTKQRTEIVIFLTPKIQSQ